MTFTSILKTIGADSLKVIKAVEGGPTVIIQEGQAIAAKYTDLKTLIDAIKRSEQMFAAAGMAGNSEAKLAAITPQINGLLQDIEILVGTKLGSIIKDEAAFNVAVQAIISDFVALLNACGK